MAVILYKGPNKTVATIADRNAITVKHDSMVVTVLDAIADPDAGAGIATFRWLESPRRHGFLVFKVWHRIYEL